MADESGDLEGQPAWQPVMTRAQAVRWAAESAFPSPVYHVTTVEAAAAIRVHGFDLGRRAGGRAWGDGVYAAVDEATRDAYLRQLGSHGVALELRVAVNRVLRIRIPFAGGRQPFEYVLAAIPDGLGRLVMARLMTPDPAAALTQVIVQAGYDALEVLEDRFSWAIGGRQLVIFDPKRIVVIDDEDADAR